MTTRRFLFLFILLSSTHGFGNEEKFPCRFDLIGEQTFAESVLEKEHLTRAECLKRAQELLFQNREYFSGIRMFPDGKVVRPKQEKAKND